MAMRCESEQVKLKCNYHPMSIIQFGSGVFNNQSKHRLSGTFPAFNLIIHWHKSCQCGLKREVKSAWVCVHNNHSIDFDMATSSEKYIKENKVSGESLNDDQIKWSDSII